MTKPLPSLSTRTREFAPRELPLTGPEPQREEPKPKPPASSPIKDAIIRWLEEEL